MGKLNSLPQTPTLIHHTTRDTKVNQGYPLEHNPEDQAAKDTTLPKSQQFADTGRTLGVSSRGIAFTGGTQTHGHNIQSSKSVLHDPRQVNEYFVEDRSGSQARPAFTGGELSLQSTGRQPDATAFTASTAAPPAEGGTGPSWIDRIKTNFRSWGSTQSSNLGTKPPEKFQIGLRSSNVQVKKQATSNSPGPVGLPSAGPQGAPVTMLSGS